MDDRSPAQNPPVQIHGQGHFETVKPAAALSGAPRVGCIARRKGDISLRCHTCSGTPCTSFRRRKHTPRLPERPDESCNNRPSQYFLLVSENIVAVGWFAQEFPRSCPLCFPSFLPE